MRTRPHYPKLTDKFEWLTDLSSGSLTSIYERHPERANPLWSLHAKLWPSCSSSDLSKLALDAERSGWDGFFLWDHLVEWDRRVPIYDSFTSLAAMAVNAERIRLGTTVTPLAKTKPWIAARQMATLDHLSNGRMILGVGLGAEESTDYERFDEVGEDRILAEKLDESLDIITGLWKARPFSYNSKHYRVKKTVFLPAPVQKTRIPIWVGGLWPRKGPFKRAAIWDGVIPLRAPSELAEPEDLREIMVYIKKHRTTRGPFDLVKIGWTSGTNQRKDMLKVAPYLEVGITWWLESLYMKQDSPEKTSQRIRQGPPKNC